MSTILIVEDEPIELDFLESIVQEVTTGKDRVLLCDNGVEAVKLAKKHRPDIILMDILIPEMDGLRALEEIRTFLPNACVLILSACSDFEFARASIGLRAHEYMLKPAKPSALRGKLQEMLNLASGRQGDEHLEEELEKPDVISESIKYIHENFREKLTLQMVATHVYMNPQYFSRIFKKEVGTNYTDYVNNLKILYACKLLETTNLPAFRISVECGFTDPSYFNRVFFKQMNITPKDYKKSFHNLRKARLDANPGNK